jgi:hypothetical protein
MQKRRNGAQGKGLHNGKGPIQRTMYKGLNWLHFILTMLG